MPNDTVQFSGESPWQALINHESLDIEEEAEFRQFCIDQRYSSPENFSSAAILNDLFIQWAGGQADA